MILLMLLNLFVISTMYVFSNIFTFGYGFIYVFSTDQNIVTLQKISSSVEMKDNATSAVKVTYYSSCLEDGPLKQTNKCDGLKVGTLVKFAADIEVS